MTRAVIGNALAAAPRRDGACFTAAAEALIARQTWRNSRFTDVNVASERRRRRRFCFVNTTAATSFSADGDGCGQKPKKNEAVLFQIGENRRHRPNKRVKKTLGLFLPPWLMPGNSTRLKSDPRSEKKVRIAGIWRSGCWKKDRIFLFKGCDAASTINKVFSMRSFLNVDMFFPSLSRPLCRRPWRQILRESATKVVTGSWRRSASQHQVIIYSKNM